MGFFFFFFAFSFWALLGQKARTEYPCKRSPVDAFPIEYAFAFLTPNLCRMFLSIKGFSGTYAEKIVFIFSNSTLHFKQKDVWGG